MRIIFPAGAADAVDRHVAHVSGEATLAVERIEDAMNLVRGL
jgi:hypothetical protein